MSRKLSPEEALKLLKELPSDASGSSSEWESEGSRVVNSKSIASDVESTSSTGTSESDSQRQQPSAPVQNAKRRRPPNRSTAPETGTFYYRGKDGTIWLKEQPRTG